MISKSGVRLSAISFFLFVLHVETTFNIKTNLLLNDKNFWKKKRMPLPSFTQTFYIKELGFLNNEFVTYMNVKNH